jgi:hypothetical protein
MGSRMELSVEEQKTVQAAAASAPAQAGRSLVLVAGSGRSGTSLFTGILQRLGFYVPEPEVPADETNPRGFAESQWVVEFHTRLLRKAGVQISDARPAAWSLMADLTLEDEVADELRKWLEEQFKESDHLIVKDPRLSWFLPLWRRCASALDVTPRFATVLRHPAAVIDSKQRYYGRWQGDISRTAGWLNQSLFTERATRETQRAFVRYEDLLDDWTKSVARVGDLLALKVIQDAPAASIVRVHDFVDRNLSRSSATWDDFEIPEGLREQVDNAWGLLMELVDEPDSADLHEQLDAARAAYIELYEDAEAIVQSSIAASPATARRGGSTFVRVGKKVPRGLRDKLPLSWRQAAFRAARGRSGSRGR